MKTEEIMKKLEELRSRLPAAHALSRAEGPAIAMLRRIDSCLGIYKMAKSPDAAAFALGQIDETLRPLGQADADVREYDRLTAELRKAEADSRPTTPQL